MGAPVQRRLRHALAVYSRLRHKPCFASNGGYHSHCAICEQKCVFRPLPTSRVQVHSVHGMSTNARLGPNIVVETWRLRLRCLHPLLRSTEESSRAGRGLTHTHTSLQASGVCVDRGRCATRPSSLPTTRHQGPRSDWGRARASLHFALHWSWRRNSCAPWTQPPRLPVRARSASHRGRRDACHIARTAARRNHGKAWRSFKRPRPVPAAGLAWVPEGMRSTRRQLMTHRSERASPHMTRTPPRKPKHNPYP